MSNFGENELDEGNTCYLIDRDIDGNQFIIITIIRFR